MVCVVVIAGAPALTVAEAAPVTVPNTVSQGSVIHRTGSRESCTVGYVNRRSSTVVTAGHCGENGSQWELRDLSGTTPLGTLRSAYGPGDIEGDIAVIGVADPTLLGVNLPYAQRIAEHVLVGERICVSGRRGATPVPASCDKVTAITGDVVFAGPGLRIAPGDSGAPAWTDAGFVGVVSGPRLEPATGEVKAVRIARVTAAHLQHVPAGNMQKPSLSSGSSLSSRR